MAVKEVLRIGHPHLLESAVKVTEFDSALDELIADMLDTMHHYDGAGLAAPQIGVGLQVIIFGVEHNDRYPDESPVPLTVLINPQIEALSETVKSDWEGCLSIPGMRGLVPRYDAISYTGKDQQGQTFSREVEGFHARVVQHEVDHLDGILYPHRIEDLRDFGYEKELFEERD